jgi:hypothetical protein
LYPALGGGGACSTIGAGIGRSTMSVSARAIPAQTAATTSAQLREADSRRRNLVCIK